MRHLIGASLTAVMLLMSSTASAQTAGEKIGQVSFPISCNPAVPKPFERGVALLHSFWYLESAKSYYVRLVAVAAPADTQRPEPAQAKAFLGSK